MCGIGGGNGYSNFHLESPCIYNESKGNDNKPEMFSLNKTQTLLTITEYSPCQKPEQVFFLFFFPKAFATHQWKKMGLFEDKEEGEIFGLVVTTFSTFP